jgi:hypothetical protein
MSFDKLRMTGRGFDRDYGVTTHAVLFLDDLDPDAVGDAGADAGVPGERAAVGGPTAVGAVLRPRKPLRLATKASTRRFTPSSAVSATAQSGNLARGFATPASIRPGEDCRWRSSSDFFSASRMNDMRRP